MFMAIQRRLTRHGGPPQRGKLPERLTRQGTRDLRNGIKCTEARDAIWKQDARHEWRRCTLMRLRLRGRKSLPQARLSPCGAPLTGDKLRRCAPKERGQPNAFLASPPCRGAQHIRALTPEQQRDGGGEAQACAQLQPCVNNLNAEQNGLQPCVNNLNPELNGQA